jgi:hypothetical protein
VNGCHEVCEKCGADCLGGHSGALNHWIHVCSRDNKHKWDALGNSVK